MIASELRAVDVRIRLQDGRRFHYTAIARSSVDAVMAAINRFGLCRVDAAPIVAHNSRTRREQ